jgi:hypothetical protein
MVVSPLSAIRGQRGYLLLRRPVLAHVPAGEGGLDVHEPARLMCADDRIRIPLAAVALYK